MLKYFLMSDFQCPCGRAQCDAAPMDAMALIKLDGLRRDFGQAMIVNSGARCRQHNKAVGGSENSEHLHGRAFDIHCPDGIYMLRLSQLALRHGFTGIGIKKRMIHLDTRPGTPVMFGY